jgi:hypothetical protein
MFSLIITIISIALVAALALATEKPTLALL